MVSGIGNCSRRIGGIRVLLLGLRDYVCGGLLILRLGSVLEERRGEVFGFVLLVHAIIELWKVSSKAQST